MVYPRYSRLDNVQESHPLEDLTPTLDKDSKDIKRALQRRTRLQKIILLAGLILSLLLNVFLAVASSRNSRVSEGPYSPASSALRRVDVVFSSGFGIQQSLFQGPPSETNNKLWESLYNFGISRVKAHEARQLPNKTLPVPDNEGGYIVQLSVFHLLHCLNLVRRGLYGEVDMTNKHDLLGIEHLDHCVDHIRQSIMCSADTAVLTFARQTPNGRAKAVAEVLHGCRDFEAIQRWALQRQIPAEVDFDVHVKDDPLGWGSYVYSP
ncbi:hypothetical protein GGS23DRAFT_618392 [Durotheca rogersii]|uniref:uncharacterized protein n=1 Tax=Durotheca rogersii TaxID=419775 RepID=UPI002220E09B|nr:uncharacterized protein GGS23DRAFT_618392 [Durotheca rogersii]KAI5865342.1 hypothetical protein GGS23DRAFT_618392 [Durotheca rogersii]